MGQKLKEKATHIKELYKHKGRDATGSDSTEKILFTLTDSAVVEA